jgi:hypothetical protein
MGLKEYEPENILIHLDFSKISNRFSKNEEILTN